MKILSCHIEAFGVMRDRSFSDLNAPVVIVEGSNEAGKSTFFHFLQTMLYGIYPVSEENHPYAPNDGERIQGSLTMESDHGGQYTVTRLLRSTVTGNFVGPDGHPKELSNQDVPFMHISKEVYKAIYALSLYDLVALQNKPQAWQAVQDRLVGGLGVNFIRPARAVIEKLDEEAKSLWRDKYDRGSASKKIAERLYELNKELGKAKARDQEIRRLTDQVAQYKGEKEGCHEERTKLLAENRRIQRLRPIRNHLRQIADAQRGAGDPAELDGLPDDPGADLATMRKKSGDFDAKSNQLEAEREHAGRILAAVEAGTGFDLNIGPGNPYEGLLRDRKRAEDDLRQQEGQLVKKARQLLTVAWDERVADILAHVAPAELRERMKRFDKVQREADTRRQAEDAWKQAVASQGAHSDASDARKTFRTQAILAGMLVVAAFVAGVLGRMELAAGLGVAGAVVGFLAWQARTQGKRGTASPAASFVAGQRSLEEIAADIEGQRAAVRALLEGLSIPESRFDLPDMNLVNEVMSLQEAERAWRDAQKRVEDRLSELQTVARQEQGRIEEQSGNLAKERSSLKAERDALKARLSALGSSDPEKGMVVVTDRKKKQQLAQTLEENLERDFAGEDMAVARREIDELEREGVAWDVSDEKAIEINERLEALNEAINDLTEQQTATKKDIENLLGEPTLAVIESEWEHLESKQKAIQERHDRLRLLQHIVREADRRFREAHQPDVLRRASEYVRTITEGRYERFDYDEDEKLRIYPAGEAVRPWSVEAPLSQGTLDQMYLALRFALIDHLDETQESLPVFLDEVFVNWDRDRRARCYDIFSEVAERRQVFVFTCHPWLAEEMEQRLPSQRISL